MTANFVLLEKITVGAAGASSVTFSGIPQTGYTDLVVKMSGRNTDTSGLVYYSFNGNTSSRTARLLYGDGSAAGSVTYDNTDPRAMIMNQSNYTASSFSNGEMYIPNYTGSNNKSWSSDSVQETNATTAFSYLLAGLWSNTAAITSITFSTFSGTFAANSTFYLYGVAKLGTTPAIVPYATGGDTIMTDGTYWYHTFLSSGTFTPAKGISCDVLAVAGGGGSGSYAAGGGGGGGVITFTSQGLATTGYTVTVGAGGAKSPADGSDSSDGSNSSFASLTVASGGGGGGGGSASFTKRAGHAGGSGGGGGSSIGTAGGATNQSGTGATNYYGNNGGQGAAFNGAGGGGAGAAAGTSSATANAANGGVGIYNSLINAMGAATSQGELSGGNYYFSGGGCGFTGYTNTYALGGGGGADRASANGTANTGGGGGSLNTSGVTGNGGSGIVIVRYAV